jgi:hypothetical protein
VPLDFAPIVANAAAIIGAVGGTVGIISGIAVFARRRLRLIVTVTANNDAHESWHTVTIANRSDLALSYRDFGLGWFIMTPLGRLRLNWAYSPDEETNVSTLPPQGTDTFRIDDEYWSHAVAKELRESAYLRAYLHLPSRGRGVWLPVRVTTWEEGSLRERLLQRMYVKREPSELDLMLAVHQQIQHS